ncbi:MAG TPA: BPSS1780 family membrane protein [Burkholderiaceae bacterium]|nr:BPSS1780 family membrane protein [Burkholderiaceae bacterium]
MQAAILPIHAGWFWIHQGYRICMKQPLAMFFWSMTLGLLITFSYLIPIFGQMALIIATPSFTFITLAACQRIDSGEAMQLGMWTLPLRDRNVRKRLLLLGLAYLLCCLAGGVLATLPYLDALTTALEGATEIDDIALLRAMQGPMLTFGVLYVLISMFFWHAPALIGWHGIPMKQALFFSMVACWRNKWAFLLYGLSWVAIFFAVQMAATLLMVLGLSPDMVQLLMTPVNIAVAAVLYASFYPAYVSVFR